MYLVHKRLNSTFTSFIALAFHSLTGSFVFAQSPQLFSVPDSSRDVARYASIDACLGAVERMMTVDYVPVIRTDTFPSGVWDAIDTLPAAVTTTAQRCSHKFTVNAMMKQSNPSIANTTSALRLLLLANRDIDAHTLVMFWIAGNRERDDSLWTAGVVAFAHEYIRTSPTRSSLAWELVDSLEARQKILEPIDVVLRLFWKSQRIRDSSTLGPTVRWLTQKSAQLSDSVKKTETWQRLYGHGILSALIVQKRDTLRDSLRKSSEAWIQLRNHLEREAGISETQFSRLITAEALAGDFWFPAKPSQSRPSHGKVAFVIAVPNDNTECVQCLAPVAVLQRLHQQFPEVEMTLIMKTTGSFGLTAEPPSPDVEAALFDSLYLKRHRLPVQLAVEQAPFWRLPEPDRRRIDEPTPNDALYGKEVDLRPDRRDLYWGITVIDRNGRIIVHRQLLLPSTEGQIADVTEDLLQQPH